MVGCAVGCTACWTMGRFRHLFATAQAREGAAEASVVGIVAFNKARDMFALILELLMDCGISNVVGSKRENIYLAGPSMTVT
jgi:hypothetical protein